LTPLDFASDRVEVNKDLAGDVFETIAGIPLFGLRKFDDRAVRQKPTTALARAVVTDDGIVEGVDTIERQRRTSRYIICHVFHHSLIDRSYAAVGAITGQ
jgi:hypothetical protein